MSEHLKPLMIGLVRLVSQGRFEDQSAAGCMLKNNATNEYM